MRLLSLLIACVFCAVSMSGVGRTVRAGSCSAQKMPARARARASVTEFPGDTPSRPDPVDGSVVECALKAEDDSLERDLMIAPLVLAKSIVRVDDPSVLDTRPRSHLPVVRASGSPLRC
jgi:hypothetical protein